jgi:endonuclease IV
MIKDYHLIGAKRFILHPEQYPGEEKINYLLKKRVNVLFENERKRHGNEKKKNHSRTAFEDILQTNKKISLCLDVSHAYSWSPKETTRIIDTWKDKIQQVHFSATHYSVSHLPLVGASKAFINSVKKVKDLNVPIIIEEDMRTSNKQWILKEINEVKKITGAE